MLTSGILVVDKPLGLTSHDIVMRIRKKLGTRKVGHAGTLDPAATGVLVMGVGESTRLLEYLTAADKVYEGEVCFGQATDTEDAVGNVVAVKDAGFLTTDLVVSAARSFMGVQWQQVPAYSAVHIEGRRAYEWARAGSVVELPHKKIEIYELKVSTFEAGSLATAKFSVHCSKGTYVRSLCRDWGTVLGLPAHLKSLRRLQSGLFSIDESVTLAEFLADSRPEHYILSALEGLRELAWVEISSSDASCLRLGQRVPGNLELQNGPVAAVCEDELVAIVWPQWTKDKNCWLQPHKVFGKGEQ
ncbi:tRNA pseudouridine(55) synthase TruB [Alicyclobacillaceae bacterium I2511]|nr:tRNA pseudouridine(55) synthase TruB [Alicyclobacillaceae bacterium I2511]